ncbi:MAG: hypothetical protein HZA24_00250 [Nitrospirae bacterium]|nr:hypothetical protein [Nitrospirota bacterium]
MTSKPWMVCALAAALLAPPVAAWAAEGGDPAAPALLAQSGDADMDPDRTMDQDMDRTRDRDAERLMERMHHDVGISASEQHQLQVATSHYLSNGGDEKNLREVLQLALRNNCRDTCMEDAVRAMNREMHQGATGAQARERVEDAIRYAASQGGGADDMGDRLRDRLNLRDRDAGMPMHPMDGSGMGGGMGGGRR